MKMPEHWCLLGKALHSKEGKLKPESSEYLYILCLANLSQARHC